MRPPALLILLLLFGLPAYAAEEGGFRVERIAAHLTEGVYQLDADLDLRLSAAVREALENGVDLTLRLEIRIRRGRDYWLDGTTAELNQRYRLRFHALSRQYLVQNLNSGVQRSFPHIDQALEYLGTVRALPILDRKLLEPDARYYGELRAVLDLEELPTPLRLMAYLSSDWHLGSDWIPWTVGD